MTAGARTWRLSAPSLNKILLLLSLLLTPVSSARERWTHAPNQHETPINQLSIGGNACGPAALLTAFKMGSQSWQAQFASIPGTNDKERLSRVIRQYGLQPSSHVKNRLRYGRRGINVADLTDIANEIAHGSRRMPTIVSNTLFLERNETPEALLRKTHRHIQSSLARGFPPLLSLRRHELRGSTWAAVDAHFVTLVALPTRLPRHAQAFLVDYIDPWNGKRCQGELAIPQSPVLVTNGQTSPCLIAIFPDADVGKKRLRKNAQSELVPSALMGRW